MAESSRVLGVADVDQAHELLIRARADLPPGQLAPWTSDQISRQILSGVSWSLWDSADGLAGFVLGQSVLGVDVAAGKGVEIQLILVDPKLRRRQLGQNLMNGIHRLCPDAQFWRLEVHENNTPARQFYASLGFAPVGVRPRYYPDGGSAVLLDVDGKELAAHLRV